MILCLFCLVPPKITNAAKKSIIAGSKESVELKITGLPTPDVLVYKDEKELQKENRIQYDLTGESFVIKWDKAVLEDEGTYKIEAKNTSGQDSSSIRIDTSGESYIVNNFLQSLPKLNDGRAP